MKKVKRLCQKDKIPNHKEASEILKQLQTNPEVCDECVIKPCIFGLYIWGPKERLLCGSNPLK